MQYVQYKVMVNKELAEDIEVLNKKRNNLISEEVITDFLNEWEEIRERINLAARLQLIDSLERQEYEKCLQALALKKLKHERKDLDKWKQEVLQARVRKNVGVSEGDATVIENNERQR